MEEKTAWESAVEVEATRSHQVSSEFDGGRYR